MFALVLPPERTAFYIWDIWHFSLRLFQGVQERANLTSPVLSKEDPIFSSLSHKLGHSVDEVGHRIHQALTRVRSASYNSTGGQIGQINWLCSWYECLSGKIARFLSRFYLFFKLQLVVPNHEKLLYSRAVISHFLRKRLWWRLHVQAPSSRLCLSCQHLCSTWIMAVIPFFFFFGSVFQSDRH